MSIGLIGRKLGMTQIFDDAGNVITVTVVEAGPCYVTEQKTVKKHGYDAVQIGYFDYPKSKIKNIKKPQKGFYDKIKVFPKKVLREFRIDQGEKVNVGDQIKADIFSQGDFIDVTGVTKGRGFQGVIKRHNQHIGPKSHGSHFHRRPGSMGGCADPSRVFKGKKLPGRMGGDNRTIQNLKVVDVNVSDNIILVEGAIPGANNNIILLSKAIKKKKASIK